MADDDLRRLVKKAIDSPRINLDNLSELTGCSIFSLRAYRLGYRLPSDRARAQLAAGLREHAGRLLNIAADLENDTWQS
jgi:hypothetical protein